jgi:hypothetical protein
VFQKGSRRPLLKPLKLNTGDQAVRLYQKVWVVESYGQLSQPLVDSIVVLAILRD